MQASADGVFDHEVSLKCMDEVATLERRITGMEVANDSKLWGVVVNALGTLLSRRSMCLAVGKEFFPILYEPTNSESGSPSWKKSVTKFATRQLVSLCPKFSLPPVWKSRHAILRTAFALLFDHAEAYELSGSSSFPILREFMLTDLGCLVALAGTRISYSASNEIVFNSMKDEQSRAILGPIVALLRDMPMYLAENLAELKLTEWQRDKLVDAVMDNFVETSNDEESLSRLGEVLKLLEPHLKDLSAAMIWADDSGVALAMVQKLRDLLTQAASSHMMENSAFHHTSQNSDNLSLLFVWAQLHCCEKERNICCMRQDHGRNYAAILDVLISQGCDVNSICFSGGTVLQAILEVNLQPIVKNHMQFSLYFGRKAKFLALVKAGINPTIATKNGDGWQAAKNFKKKRKIRVGRVKRKKAYMMDMEDIDFIIECLDYYRQHGMWPEDCVNEAILPVVAAEAND